MTCSAARAAARSIAVLAVSLSSAVALPAAVQAAPRDRDRDGLSDRLEVRVARTDPGRADTDRDGLRDGYELRRSRTSPRRADTDGDGLQDGYELRRSKTDPRRADTDRDGASDGREVAAGTDPRRRSSRPAEPAPAPPAPEPAAQPEPPAATPEPSPDPDPAPDPDTVAPDTTIASGPSGTVASPSASFSFGASERASTFACRLDAGAGGVHVAEGLRRAGERLAHVRRARDRRGGQHGRLAGHARLDRERHPAGARQELHGGSVGLRVPRSWSPWVRRPATTLTPVSGAVTLSQAGQVYENKRGHGRHRRHRPRRDDPQRQADHDEPVLRDQRQAGQQWERNDAACWSITSRST